MIESLITGYKALMKSAEKLGIDEDDEEVKESWLYRVFGEKLMAVIGGIAGVLGVALALLLFMWLPTVVFNLVNGIVTPRRFAFLPRKGCRGRNS